MEKKIFISYSRKNDLDVIEFRTIKKNRNFEILIDDEDITFNQTWKANIRKKLMILMVQFYFYLIML